LKSNPLPCVAAQPTAIVLDTNVVLDWLVFGDPSCTALAEGVMRGQLTWHTTAAMRSELLSVLGRAELAAWRPDYEHILLTFDRWAVANASPGALTPQAPRCRDPDDQKFIDLSLAVGARWLLTRDRALLELAKAARIRGVDILSPVDWLRRLDVRPP